MLGGYKKQAKILKHNERNKALKKKFIIDTNIIISHLRKRDKKITEFFKQYCKQPQFISQISYFEILTGALGKKKFELTKKELSNYFSIISLDEIIIKNAYNHIKIYAENHQKVNKLTLDALIVGTCIYLDLPLVTENIKDMILNPELKIIKP
ncbi:MAG: type II toxin-antitoxin system VapC family toxin [bacterium]